jgi:hypothetical protein
MQVWVVIVESKGGHVFCPGVFDTHQAAFNCMLPYSDKYGQHSVWIVMRVINEELTKGKQ